MDTSSKTAFEFRKQLEATPAKAQGKRVGSFPNNFKAQGNSWACRSSVGCLEKTISGNSLGVKRVQMVKTM